MTGMKQGAGENPFADDDSAESASEAEEQEEQTASESETEAATSEQDSDRQQLRIPYKFRRDGVQDGRSRVPLFLQEETKRGERDAQRELEARVDDDVSLTDLREAVVLVGLQHLDEVESQLEEWGYGMTFDD
ncbi:hypothetical protein [Salinirubrum litoreum]|uniref:Uncharacterized protein n=1 Tax=Salinirubrum litoreum TaxID=1126234 RepID=A0ABD5RGP5_9EURY|nr:hypothetical protein [Salinirubrum litoreum]